VGEKWGSGRDFEGIVPRNQGLKRVVLALFLQTKGIVLAGRREHRLPK
jgi:hypothetical protein